jgi:hypothetical protein
MPSAHYILVLVLHAGPNVIGAGALPKPFDDWQACHNVAQWFENEGVHAACVPTDSMGLPK